MAEQEFPNSHPEGEDSKTVKNISVNFKLQEDENWRKDKNTLKRGAYLLEKGKWSDCSFTVQSGEEPPQNFKCHKVILASASPVFEAMFFGLAKESEDIKVTDIAPSSFKIMLQYIYTEVLPELSFDQFLHLGFAADKYLVDKLRKQCLKKMNLLLKPENALQAFEFAQITGCEWLEEDAFEIMKIQIEDVIKSETIFEAHQSTMETLLDSDDLNVKTEIVLWKTIVNWGQKQCLQKGITPEGKGLRQAMDPLLPHIRFLTMSSAEFSEGPAMSGVLTEKECLDILLLIASTNIPVSLPGRFSLVRTKRTGKMYVTDVRETYDNSFTIELFFRANIQFQIKGFLFHHSFLDSYGRVRIDINGTTKSIVDNYMKSQGGYSCATLVSPVHLERSKNYNVVFVFNTNSSSRQSLAESFENIYLKGTRYIQAMFV